MADLLDPEAIEATPADVQNRAVWLDRFGELDAIAVRQAPLPEPGPEAVRVFVGAASVNPVDAKMRQGKFAPIGEDRLPLVVGRDLAGTIEKVGPGGDARLGTRVFAFIGFDRGAQSDFAIVRTDELAAVPERLDTVHAAAVPLAALTAWQGLFDHGGLTAGQTVLIHGGAGGVGHFAIQLAKARGAAVVTTCSGDDMDFVLGLGADRAIDYKAERFEDIVHDADMVFDLVGGETQDRSWQVLREGGILVCTMQQPDMEKARAHRVRAAPRWLAEPSGAQLREVAGLIDAGKVEVVVSETFRIEEARAAQRRLAEGHVRGKIVLTLD